jgi:hypothetical protein
MSRLVLALPVCLLLPVPAVRADHFDRYTNPVLAKVPSAAGVKELKQLTPDLLTDNDRVLPDASAALVVVRTNGDRFAKLLVAPARRKVGDTESVPILLIERFVTYREGQERAVQAEGRNVHLFNGFHFDLDSGQVVPAALGGDLRFVAAGGKQYAEPLGHAKLYLVTKALPEAAPKKGAKLEVGAAFEPRYFNGTYKLHADGRRSGTLTLQVGEGGEVSGAFYSDKDGRKYEVAGKVGSPPHAVQFTIKFPRSAETFQGLMFTGDGKALAGSSRFQERETGFYATRVEEQ